MLAPSVQRAICTAGFALTACLPGASIEVHNNTGRDLVVISGSQDGVKWVDAIFPGDSITAASGIAWWIAAADGPTDKS